MSETKHRVLVEIDADTKKYEAGTRRVAKDANKLTKDQKKAMGESIANTKKLHQTIGNPQQQSRNAQQELRHLREKIKLINTENRLIRERTRAMSAAITKQRKDYERAERTTVRGGFRKAMGFQNPNDRNAPNWRSRLGAGLGGALRAGIGLGGMGLAALASIPVQAISQDYQAYFSYARQRGGLAGLARGAPFGAGLTTGSVDEFRERMGGLGYSPEESLAGIKSFTRATGSGSAAAPGMRAARALGLETDEVSGIFAELRRGGGSFGEKGYRDFQRVLAAAVKSGVDSSTLPEYLEGVKSLTAGAGGAAGGAVSALPYAQLLAIFEKSGAAGLKGARGASMAGALEEGIKHPGGGDEGLAVVMASMGFGRAGGNTSYYAAKKMMEQGFQGPQGSAAIKNLFDYVDTITGGGEESNLYMEGLMGGRLTLDQIETVRKALTEGASTDDVSKMLEDMTATELDHLTSIDNNIKEFLGATIRSAKIANEDITRGEKNREAIEQMQDAVHKLLEDTLPIVQATLPVIADGITFLGGGITKMVEVAGEIAAYFNDSDMSDTMDAWTQRFRKSDTKFEKMSDLMDTSVSRTLHAAEVASLTGMASTSINELADIGEALASEELSGAVPGSLAETTRTMLESEKGLDLVRLTAVIEALDRNLRARGEDSLLGDDRRATGVSEMLAVLTAYGITLPPSVRAIIDRTGGGS